MSGISPSAVDAESPETQAAAAGAAADRPRIYYGWWIVAITFAGTFFATGIHDTVFSVLLKPISADLGWSRTQISLPISLSLWVGALLSPFVGRMLDKRGPRLLSSAGAFIIGLVYMLLSVMGQFWQFALFYPFGRVSSQATMLGSVASGSVSKWFIRRRGRALGIQSMAIGLGGATLSLAAQLIINRWGWRAVFVVFGLAMWFVVVIPAALFLRRRPEDMGLLPDGDTEPVADGTAAGTGHHSHGHGLHGHHGHHGQARVREADFTVRQALASPSLWLLVAISVISSTGTGAIHLHTAAYLTDVGITPTTAAAVVSVSALVGALGSFLWGFLGERLPTNWAFVIIYLGAAASVLVLASVRAAATAFAFAFLFGLSTRGGHVISALATANYFGRNNIGAIQGMVVPIQTAGLGFGQIFAPMIHQASGSYRLAFLILAGLYAVAAMIGIAVRPPKDPAVAVHPA